MFWILRRCFGAEFAVALIVVDAKQEWCCGRAERLFALWPVWRWELSRKSL